MLRFIYFDDIPEIYKKGFALPTSSTYINIISDQVTHSIYIYPVCVNYKGVLSVVCKSGNSLLLRGL